MADLLPWRCGMWTASVDPATGFLRYLSTGGVELLRGVYVAVRDPDWSTVAPAIRDWRLDHDRLSFTAECHEGPIDFVWHGAIEIRGETLRYTMDGEARSTFRRNRVGFCVLHPMDAAETSCRVEHLDGTIEQAVFPAAVAAHQPFYDIRAIRHEPAPGLAVEVRCEGDAFEMEDQRNWTDASFKTYCTPLGLPFPAEVPQGTRIQQSITLTLCDRRPYRAREARRSEAHDAVITISEHPTGRLPAIGLGHHPAADPAALRPFQPAHLRVDLDLAEPDWPHTLAVADNLGYPLELAIIDDPRVAPTLPSVQSPIARVLLFDADRRATRPHNLDRWRPLLRDLGAPLAGGTDAYFAELNREPPPLGDLDRLTFSINPQVHAFDDASLVETIAAQEAVARCAMQLSRGRPVGVSTVTLLPRFNPNATSGSAAEPGIDPRQDKDFCAAWTVGSLNALARSGVASVTYYETAGPRGVIGFPVSDVLFALAGATEVYQAQSDQPLVAAAVVVQQHDGPVALVANLTARRRTVRLEPAGLLVELGPYQVAQRAVG